MSNTTVWTLIVLVAVTTALIKAFGPLAVGHANLSPRFVGVISLLAPALLCALVVTHTLADDKHLQVGAQTAGVAIAGIAMWRGVTILWAVLIAVVVTAGLRAL